MHISYSLSVFLIQTDNISKLASWIISKSIPKISGEWQFSVKNNF